MRGNHKTSPNPHIPENMMKTGDTLIACEKPQKTFQGREGEYPPFEYYELVNSHAIHLTRPYLLCHLDFLACQIQDRHRRNWQD